MQDLKVPQVKEGHVVNVGLQVQQVQEGHLVTKDLKVQLVQEGSLSVLDSKINKVQLVSLNVVYLARVVYQQAQQVEPQHVKQTSRTGSRFLWGWPRRHKQPPLCLHARMTTR